MYATIRLATEPAESKSVEYLKIMEHSGGTLPVRGNLHNDSLMTAKAHLIINLELVINEYVYAILLLLVIAVKLGLYLMICSISMP